MQVVAPPVSDLARDLVALAIHVFKESSQEYHELVDELELSVTQLRTLGVLEHRDVEPSVKQLSELIGLSLPATSRNVDGLLRRGLLERQEDGHDRRVKRLCLTAAGRELVQRVDAARLAGMQQFTETLTEQQRTRLSGALASLMVRPELCACRPPQPKAAR
ncbi:MAG: MarR family winged helix-turn-helix transcriptional regulator [Solirubrobacteraceae bacterium]